MFSPCCRHGLAVSSPCSRRVLALFSPCSRRVPAVFSPCSRCVLAVLSPLSRRVLCSRSALSPCSLSVWAGHWQPCSLRASPVPGAWGSETSLSLARSDQVLPGGWGFGTPTKPCSLRAGLNWGSEPSGAGGSEPKLNLARYEQGLTLVRDRLRPLPTRGRFDLITGVPAGAPKLNLARHEQGISLVRHPVPRR